MIEIKHSKNLIAIKGHAGYAEYGHDIVCSAVCTLAQTLAESIERLTADKIECKFESGDIEIKYGNLSERGILLVDSFFCGVSEVAEAYPENVKVELF